MYMVILCVLLNHMDGLVYKSRFIGPACFINVDGNIVRLVEPPSFVYKSRLIGPACFINVYGNIVRLVKPYGWSCL